MAANLSAAFEGETARKKPSVKEVLRSIHFLTNTQISNYFPLASRKGEAPGPGHTNGQHTTNLQTINTC